MNFLGLLLFTLGGIFSIIWVLFIIAYFFEKQKVEQNTIKNLTDKINSLSTKYLHTDKLKDKFNIQNQLLANWTIFLALSFVASILGQFCYRLYYERLITESTKQQIETQKEVLKTIQQSNQSAKELQKSLENMWK